MPVLGFPAYGKITTCSDPNQRIQTKGVGCFIKEPPCGALDPSGRIVTVWPRCYIYDCMRNTEVYISRMGNIYILAVIPKTTIMSTNVSRYHWRVGYYRGSTFWVALSSPPYGTSEADCSVLRTPIATTVPTAGRGPRCQDEAPSSVLLELNV